MMVKGRTMLVASKQASKQSIAQPFSPVKGKTAYFLRRIPPVFIRAGCAFLRCPADGAKNFCLIFTARSIKA